jgi:ubiquinone/menaquinone biosynthesis C-methylase UbiE
MDLSEARHAAIGVPLMCPHCRLLVRKEHGAQSCEGCGRRYPAGTAYTDFLLDSRGSAESEGERQGRNRQAREYDRGRIREKGALYFSMLRALVARTLRPIPPGPILDAGCGTGLVTEGLLGLGRDIVALDFSDASLEVLAQKRFPRLQPVLGSVTAIPAPDGAFAAIHCSGVLQAVPPPERKLAYAEFARCLAPGGLLVVMAWNEAHYRFQHEPVSGVFRSGIPYFSFTHDQMADEARAAGFSKIQVRPLGLALHIQARRGGRWLFPTIGKLLHPLEGWLHPMLPANRPYRSEYWLMLARRP